MTTDTLYQPFAWATICEHPVRRHPRREQGSPGWRTHALCHSRDEGYQAKAETDKGLVVSGVVVSCGPHRVVPLWYWPGDAVLVALDEAIASIPEKGRARLLANLVRGAQERLAELSEDVPGDEKQRTKCTTCSKEREEHPALRRCQRRRVRQAVSDWWVDGRKSWVEDLSRAESRFQSLDELADRITHALSDVEVGTCAECYKPLATEADATESMRHNADGGCECGRCMSVCWTSYGGQCEAWE